MVKTLWVKATTTDRQVILSEYDDAHPGNHEAWIVGYPDVVTDAGETVIGNVPIEVGDTGLVRQRIAEGTLEEVERPQAKQRAARMAESPPPSPPAT